MVSICLGVLGICAIIFDHFLTLVCLYMMALNGGLNLGLGKLKTVVVSFGLAYFPPIIFAFTAMVLGIGILPSLKVILRYPATFIFPITTIVFAAPVEYESKSCVPCNPSLILSNTG